MMGDLVLLQEEVNPVMSALLDNGIEVTALHNHFFWDDPHVYFMHVHGMGKAADLAKRIKPGLDLNRARASSRHRDIKQWFCGNSGHSQNCEDRGT